MGEVRTFVYTGKNFSHDAWFNGLKAGRTFVSNGPALFLDADGQLPGSEISKPKGSTNLFYRGQSAYLEQQKGSGYNKKTGRCD